MYVSHCAFIGTGEGCKVQRQQSLQERVYRVLTFLRKERSWMAVTIVAGGLGQNLVSLILQQMPLVRRRRDAD